MELWFFMGLVTPPIHFGSVILYVGKPRLVSLLYDAYLEWYLRPIVFPPMLCW